MRPSTLSIWWLSIFLIAPLELCAAKIQHVTPHSVLGRNEVDLYSKTNWTDTLIFPRVLTDGDADPRDTLGPCVQLCGIKCCGSQQGGQGSQKLRRDLFPFQDDISEFTQTQLGQYIIGRTNPGADPDMQFVANIIDGRIEPDNLQIFMQLNNLPDIALPIPTSIFQEFGDMPFSIGMASLIGCTTVVWVGTFDEDTPDKKLGVWMSHIWEEPGFIDMIDDEEDPPSTALAAQSEDWIFKFIEEGFPTSSTPNRATTPADKPEPVHQDGAGEHLDNLQGGSVFIMHPNRVSGNDDNIEYLGIAQYLETNAQMKARIKTLDDTAQINKEFLYKPDRSGDTEALRDGFSGRALFEYVPNRRGLKYARLLMEDGGDDRSGFKEFNLGPATS